MKETAYAYAVAYTRTIENKMLLPTDLDYLLNATSVQQALKYLADKGYGHSQTGAQTLDSMLKAELEYAWTEVRGACPEGAPIDILLYQNDFHNLKTILKTTFANAPWEALMLHPSTVDPILIYEAVHTDHMEDLPPLLRAPAIEAYGVLARTQDGQLAEIILDRACFACLYQAAEQSHSEFLIHWVDLNAAIADMKTALRGAISEKNKAFLQTALFKTKQLDLDNLLDAATQNQSAVLAVLEQSGFAQLAEAARHSIGAFEKACDNLRMSYLRTIRGKAFGFEPILGFLIGKQTELQAVRIILSGLEHQISPDILRERLRDLYV